MYGGECKNVSTVDVIPIGQQKLIIVDIPVSKSGSLNINFSKVLDSVTKVARLSTWVLLLFKPMKEYALFTIDD